MLLVHYLVYFLVVILTLAAVALNVISLPGNWLILLAGLILSACYGWDKPHWAILPVILIILLLAEIIEFASGIVGAKKFGASRAAAWAAVAGTMLGGLIGIPPLAFLLGIDHLIGAVLGAFLGAWIVELIRQRPLKEASLAALGAGLGRGVGIVTKIGAGLVAWVVLTVAAFPWW
ncbi:MAG TPA: DUF456 domain-containing protein [Phycisphaerae bacterium]|jgi:uncharacterized protein YqgC (DUF456 family)|nr:DUF456 domain-containing protein [Phycisphaerae bacterium]